MSDKSQADDAPESNRQSLYKVAAIVVSIVSGIVIPIVIWVVPGNSNPSCDRQLANIGSVEVDKNLPFSDYLAQQGWSAKHVSREQLQERVDIVSARIDVEDYPSLYLKFTAYRRNSAGRILTGSVVDRPVLELRFGACETQQRVLTYTPALHGRATYEMSLSDLSNQELDWSRTVS
jgi:hypothetical protein